MEPARQRAAYDWKADFLQISMPDPSVTGHQLQPAVVLPGFVIRQGQTWRQVVKLVDEQGSPWDLTSYSARMSIKNRPGGTSYDALVSTGVGPEIVLGGTAGTITFTLSSTTTAAYTFTRGAADLELFTSATPAVVVSILSAPVRLDREVTA
jgi:hypothetical protein